MATVREILASGPIGELLQDVINRGLHFEPGWVYGILITVQGEPFADPQVQLTISNAIATILDPFWPAGKRWIYTSPNSIEVVVDNRESVWLAMREILPQIVEIIKVATPAIIALIVAGAVSAILYRQTEVPYQAGRAIEEITKSGLLPILIILAIVAMARR